MKKQNLIIVVLLATIIGFASCNTKNADTKNVLSQLKTEEDSINYLYGVLNGDYFKDNLFGDSIEKVLPQFLKEADNAMQNGNSSELYTEGLRFGKNLIQQNANGLMSNEKIKFDKDLLFQGVINGLNQYEKGKLMTDVELNEYIPKAIKSLSEPESIPATKLVPADSIKK